MHKRYSDTIKPNNLPKTWQIKELGEVLILNQSGIWGDEPDENKKSYPVIRSTEMTHDGQLDLTSVALRHIDEDKLDRFSLNDGDILIVKSSGSSNLIGRCALFKHPSDKITYLFSNFIQRLRPNNLISPKFLYYFLNFEGRKFVEYLQTTTTGLRNLPIKQYLELQIPLPTLSDQHRIVKKIEELFEKIDKAKNLREEAIQDTENIIPAALNEIFSNGKKGWEMKKLGNAEVAEIVMGQSPPSEFYNDKGEGLPFYQGKADFGFLYPTPKKWCNNPQKIAKKNDILISVRAPVGPTNICVEDSCIGRGLAAIRSKSRLNYMYLLYRIRFKEPEIAEMGQGSTFGAIRKEDIEQLEIPFPPLPEQHRIVKYMDSLQSQIRQLKQLQSETQKELADLKKSILDKAFKGELN